jgi:hypothetical protein
MKLTRHMTTEQHMRAAALLNQAQDNLKELCDIVRRAPYTDRTLQVGKAIQELLIDPLREAWADDLSRSVHQSPYQSVGYGIRPLRGMRRRTVP